MAFNFKYEMEKAVLKLQMWVAWHLPKGVVMWCSVRLMAHATQGKYGSTVVPSLTAMDALKRWEEEGETKCLS